MSFEQEVRAAFKGHISDWHYEADRGVEVMVHEEEKSLPNGDVILVTGVVKTPEMMYEIDILQYQAGSETTFRYGQLQEVKLIDRVQDAVKPWQDHVAFFKKVLN